jgi:hypothetical protein
LVVVSFDADDGWLVNTGSDNFPLFKVGRDMRDVMADVAKSSSKTSIKLPVAPEEVSGAG